MSKLNFDKKIWTVYTDERGQHKLMSPNCEDVHDLVGTIAVDIVNKPTICEAIFLVNLVTDRDAALKGYGVETHKEKQ